MIVKNKKIEKWIGPGPFSDRKQQFCIYYNVLNAINLCNGRNIILSFFCFFV